MLLRLEEESRTRLRDKPGLGDRCRREVRSADLLLFPIVSSIFFLSSSSSFVVATSGHEGTDVDIFLLLPDDEVASSAAAPVLDVLTATALAGVAVAACLVVGSVEEFCSEEGGGGGVGLEGFDAVAAEVESEFASTRRFRRSFLRPSVGNPCFFKAARSSATFMLFGSMG